MRLPRADHDRFAEQRFHHVAGANIGHSLVAAIGHAHQFVWPDAASLALARKAAINRNRCNSFATFPRLNAVFVPADLTCQFASPVDYKQIGIHSFFRSSEVIASRNLLSSAIVSL